MLGVPRFLTRSLEEVTELVKHTQDTSYLRAVLRGGHFLDWIEIFLGRFHSFLAQNEPVELTFPDSNTNLRGVQHDS